MVRSIEKGLSLRDWDMLTIGQIIDYIIEFNNLNSDEVPVRVAGQKDFDSF